MTRRQPHSLNPQPLPRIWLFSDERIGEALLPALRRLPKGAGVVFRHYTLDARARRALYEEVRRIAKARRQVLVLAGSPRGAMGWRADGVHGHSAHRAHGLRTVPVHNVGEMVVARRLGADLAFVSPVFATRSHPHARVLGRRGFAQLAHQASMRVIALGGMTAARARHLPYAYGWAGIDAWITPTRSEV